MHYIIGIDIGISGAVARVDINADDAVVADMPVTKDGDNRVDARGLVALLRLMVPTHCTAEVVIENVRPRPEGNKGKHGNSMHSQASMMRQRGAIEAVVDCLGFNLSTVEPATWKRRYGLIGQKKEASRQAALSLYAGRPVVDNLKRKRDEARAEALLIARHHQGITR